MARVDPRDNNNSNIHVIKIVPSQGDHPATLAAPGYQHSICSALAGHI